MNIIKYLPTIYKLKCIECEAPLKKDVKNHEIYCSKCGFIYLDYAPMTKPLIDYAVNHDKDNFILGANIGKKSQKKSQIKSR